MRAGSDRVHGVRDDGLSAADEPVAALRPATGRSRAASLGSVGVRSPLSRGPIALALATAAVATSVAAASGHGGGGPALEAFPSEARVGDTVSLFGEDLDPLGPVNVVMLTADGTMTLLEAETDEDGHFTDSFVVPDLPERIYELLATDAAGAAASTFLLVGPSEAAADESWLTSPSGLLAIAVLVVGGLALALRARPRTRPTARR